MKNINIWNLIFGAACIVAAVQVYRTGLIRSVIDVSEIKGIISAVIFLFGSYFIFLSFK